MSNTIEISFDLARQTLPCLKERLEFCEQQVDTYESEAAKLRTSVAELEAKLAGSLTPPTHVNGKERQRSPKGHGEQVIITLLGSLPCGSGLTVKEIETKTGLNHSVVYKTLNRKEDKFILDGKKWRLK